MPPTASVLSSDNYLKSVDLGSLSISSEVDLLSHQELKSSTNRSRSPSIVSVDSGSSQPTTYWPSLLLIYGVLLLCGLQMSIYFTSLWPFFSSIDKNATETSFGFIIAVYSLGQGFGSPLLGYVGNRLRSTRIPVYIGMSLVIAGNIMVAFVEDFAKQWRFWALMGGRLLVGFGAGNVSVLRSYVATASTAKDRTKAISLSIGMFVLGMILGPSLQTALKPIGYPAQWAVGPLQLDMYTAPAYLSIVSAAIVCLLFTFAFKERNVAIAKETQNSNLDARFCIVPKFDLTAALVMIYCWFVLGFVGINIESILAPYTMAFYGWTEGEAVEYNGYMFTASASISVLLYLSFAFTRLGRVDPRKCIISGFLLFIGYHLVTMNWPFWTELPPFQTLINNTDNATSMTRGCRPDLQWCAFVGRIPLWLFFGADIVVLGCAYPFVAAPSGTLFSQILGPRRQGTMQGFFLQAASVSRMIGPIFVTWAFDEYGPNIPWIAEALMLTSAVMLLVVFYKRLIPLDANPKLLSGQWVKYKTGTMYRF